MPDGRLHRQLYEAVLQVEREGGTVAERPLALVDVLLAPSAGLVVCDNSAAQQVSGRPDPARRGVLTSTRQLVPVQVAPVHALSSLYVMPSVHSASLLLLLQEYDAFLEGLQPVLERLSYALGRVVLVLLGSTGFQAQALCGMDRLLVLGRRLGLHLQCHVSAGVPAAAAVLRGVTQAWLARWQALEPDMRYAVPDEPSPEEAFLTR